MRLFWINCKGSILVGTCNISQDQGQNGVRASLFSHRQMWYCNCAGIPKFSSAEANWRSTRCSLLWRLNREAHTVWQNGYLKLNGRKWTPPSLYSQASSARTLSLGRSAEVRLRNWRGSCDCACSKLQAGDGLWAGPPAEREQGGRRGGGFSLRSWGRRWLPMALNTTTSAVELEKISKAPLSKCQMCILNWYYNLKEDREGGGGGETRTE